MEAIVVSSMAAEAMQEATAGTEDSISEAEA
jgi:hypothetical protein